MESMILIAALILNPRARRRRQRVAREGPHAEPHSDPEALTTEVREMRCAGCGTVDFTRSMTLNTVVNDNPCNVSVDTEKKMEKVQEKEEIIPEEDQQEKLWLVVMVIRRWVRMSVICLLFQHREQPPHRRLRLMTGCGSSREVAFLLDDSISTFHWCRSICDCNDIE